MARRENDAYDTLLPLARALVARVAEVRAQGLNVDASSAGLTILEPTSGGGSFVRAAREVWPQARIGAVDINAACEEAARSAGADGFACADILEAPAETLSQAHLAIGNPPFVISERVISHLLDAGIPVVAMLLPVGFLASAMRHATADLAGRDGIFVRYPDFYFAPIAPRPSFTGDGKTDRMEYGLFMWGVGNRIGPAIKWEKP